MFPSGSGLPFPDNWNLRPLCSPQAHSLLQYLARPHLAIPVRRRQRSYLFFGKKTTIFIRRHFHSSLGNNIPYLPVMSHESRADLTPLHTSFISPPSTVQSLYPPFIRQKWFEPFYIICYSDSCNHDRSLIKPSPISAGTNPSLKLYKGVAKNSLSSGNSTSSGSNFRISVNISS